MPRALPRNLPNLITGGRLVLAVLLFALLWVVGRVQADPDGAIARHAASSERLLLDLSLVIFLLAAISDILDGQIARRWNLQTDFGRIVDPFADKVIVCGAFVMVVPLAGSQVSPWMVVVILARELLVDGLRGFAESRGIAFPASFSGKLKMVLQSTCLSWIFFALANHRGAPWADGVTQALLALTLTATLVSGLVYVLHARRVLRADAIATLSPAPSTVPSSHPGASSIGGGA